MRKVMKKLGMTIAALCMMLMIPVITSYAAEGTLQFSDPTGKVGEEITVKVKMEGGGLPIGDGTATLTYDAAKLEFVSGTNATAENGTITIAASGTGAETELNFELVFKALAEGETSISVTGSTAYLFSDETLNLQPGTSTVKVEAGDGTTSTATESGERKVGEENIEVAGTMYGIYENFTDALIPEGFSKTTITYNGEEHNAIKQDASGTTIVYLVTGSNDPVMAVFKEDKFVVTELVSQADDSYLLVLGETDGSALPEQFQPTTIEINGTQFPAWQNMESPDYFLMYALSSAGTEGYYQYDSVEETYQRYTVEEVEPKEEEKPGNPIIEKAKALVNEYFLIVLVAGVALFLLMLIILIVLSVKLRSRNADLDAFYDEYEDDDAPETEYDEEYDDEYEEEYDEEYDDEYDDEYDEEYDDDEEYEEYEEYEDDDEDDDRKKRGFDIEFIDL